MCAKTRPDLAWAESSRRLRSFHAGSVLRNTPGFGWDEYHPTPKPSPFVVSAPKRECLLCTTSELVGLKRRSSKLTGEPEYASHRHITWSFPSQFQHC
jgi:hypothetical protein